MAAADSSSAPRPTATANALAAVGPSVPPCARTMAGVIASTRSANVSPLGGGAAGPGGAGVPVGVGTPGVGVRVGVGVIPPGEAGRSSDSVMPDRTMPSCPTLLLRTNTTRLRRTAALPPSAAACVRNQTSIRASTSMYRSL